MLKRMTSMILALSLLPAYALANTNSTLTLKIISPTASRTCDGKYNFGPTKITKKLPVIKYILPADKKTFLVSFCSSVATKTKLRYCTYKFSYTYDQAKKRITIKKVTREPQTQGCVWQAYNINAYYLTTGSPKAD